MADLKEESMSETMYTRLETGSYGTYLNRSGEGNEESTLFLHGSCPGATEWSNRQFALPALVDQFGCIAPDLFVPDAQIHVFRQGRHWVMIEE